MLGGGTDLEAVLEEALLGLGNFERHDGVEGEGRGGEGTVMVGDEAGAFSRVALSRSVGFSRAKEAQRRLAVSRRCTCRLRVESLPRVRVSRGLETVLSVQDFKPPFASTKRARGSMNLAMKLVPDNRDTDAYVCLSSSRFPLFLFDPDFTGMLEDPREASCKMDGPDAGWFWACRDRGAQVRAQCRATQGSLVMCVGLL